MMENVTLEPKYSAAIEGYAGIKAYEAITNYNREKTKEKVLFGAYVFSWVMPVLEDEATELASHFFPNVPNQNRLEEIQKYKQDIDLLNTVKTDSTVAKNNTNHFKMVPVEKFKKETYQALTSVEAKPKSLTSKAADQSGSFLAFSPILIMAGALGYRFLFKKPCKRILNQFKEMQNILPFNADISSNPKEIAEKINKHAVENDLVPFFPAKRQKVLGIF